MMLKRPHVRFSKERPILLLFFITINQLLKRIPSIKCTPFHHRRILPLLSRGRRINLLYGAAGQHDHILFINFALSHIGFPLGAVEASEGVNRDGWSPKRER